MDEIWFEWTSPAHARTVLGVFSDLDTGAFQYPEGVRLVAGPWFSNEEAKLLMVLDIADHAKTFLPFQAAVAGGMIARRRLTPVVEWSALRELVGLLAKPETP